MNNAPSSAQLAAVTYLTGINASGALVSPAFSAWNQDYPATYNTSTNTTRKWENNAGGTQATSTSTAGAPGGNVTYSFAPSSNFTQLQQQAFTASLTLWSDEANIQFTQVSATSTADVVLSLGYNTGTYEGSAPASYGIIGSTSIPDNLTPTTSYNYPATITFDTSGAFGTLGVFSPGADYGYSSLIHEVGHLLGLGHSGPYSDGASQAQLDQAQASPFDSRQWSDMSYIQPDDTSAKYYSQYTVTGTNWTATATTSNSNGGTTTYFYPIAPQTPMPLDILAAQQLYGAPTTSSLLGGQVFGFNCNVNDAAEPFFDFSKNIDPVVTLWDAGTGNTLDLSGYSTASTVDLNPGTFSSAGPLTNNIGIAFGTRIDKVIGGAGNDTFTVNSDNDVVNGGGGVNVVIFGDQRAAYTVTGTVASLQVTDNVTGAVDHLSNVQTLKFADGSVSSVSYGNTAAASDFTGDGKSDLLEQNTNGTLLIYTMNGLSVAAATSVGNPGPAWHAVGSADFNGDGQPDILVQNDDSTIVDYLMNGTNIVATHDLGTPGAGWHARGTGDFNADGHADIVLQNDNSAVYDNSAIYIYTTDGVAVTGGISVAMPGVGWTVEGVADFNGDGQPDILVQNTNGQIVDYLMNGTAVASANYLGNPGAGWAVAGTGDYNGDGKADILLHNDNGSDVLWETNGSSVTGQVYVGDPGASYTGAVAGVDLNGDGSSDLVIQNTNSTLVGYTLDNNATITAGAVLGTPGAGWSAIGNNAVQYIDGTTSSAGTTIPATPGADQFKFTSFAIGPHYISGFDPAQDSVAFSQGFFGNYAAIQAAEYPYTPPGGSPSTYIQLGSGAALVIQGVTPDHLSASNFVLR